MNDQELAELDREMAEVMGWELAVDTDGWSYWVDAEWYYHYCTPDTPDPDFEPWQPTRRIQQAMMVLEKVGDIVKIVRGDAFWFVTIYPNPETGAKDLSHAICLAVKEAWEKGGDADVVR